ncbi:MAG: hypothetical protein COA99_06925 [Moraxellaceae bacterium]|nr:MAG: hypothetical protein COA99_06925 [Moraxellaceae bacterium]
MNIKKKLSQDKKILRTIDRIIAQHGHYKWVGMISIFILVAFAGDLYRDHVITTMAFGSVALTLGAIDFFLVVRFDAIYGAGPARWRRWFVMNHWMSGMFWAIFSVSIILYYPLSTSAFLVVMLAIGMCCLTNVEWSPYYRANLIFQSAVFIPLIFFVLLSNTLNAYAIGAMLLTIYAMLLRQAKMLNKRHWSTIYDRHELEMKARDLNQAVTIATEASQVKAKFLTNITYEIRTPMNNVLGMLALLDDTQLSPQQQKLQEVAVQSGESLLHLLEDVLDFSRIASGSVVLNESMFNLRRCIDQVLEVLGPVAHGRGIDLSSVYERNVPLRLKGDRERLTQIVSNLVSKAIGVCDGTEVVVRIRLDRDDKMNGRLSVSIVLDGAELAGNVVDTVFEAFCRSEDMQDTNEETGLGLAISKGLVECMGGNIGFENSESEGTYFWFTANVGVSTQQAQKDDGAKMLRGKIALLVGLPRGVEESLRSELDSWGMHCTAVGSVKDQENIIELLKRREQEGHPYDVVYINSPLRKNYNLDLSEYMLKNADVKLPKQVIMTSLAQRGMDVQHQDQGVQDVEWLTKPLTRSSINHVLAKLFSFDEKLTPSDAKRKNDDTSEEQDKHILLVEDNKVNQMVARGMLTKLGYQVTTANHGKEALSILDQKPFDLILMDCLMPEMDGYAATEAVRKREGGGKRTPIIAMTASVIEGEESHCLAAGMDDYLAKPVNVVELGGKLREWLGEGRDQDIGDDQDVPLSGQH